MCLRAGRCGVHTLFFLALVSVFSLLAVLFMCVRVCVVRPFGALPRIVNILARCRWWWAFLATPGGGSRARFPATPGWVSLSAVVCGVWCVVCGVRWWCVGGGVAGVWCGWSLATPGGGSCVLLPATPSWVSLPVVARGPRHSWLRVPDAVPRHSWLGSAGGGGVWCVVCGGGVLVGVWLVCGVVAPSPLLAEVPVCYSPPVLAGFRYRWWRAVLATPG